MSKEMIISVNGREKKIAILDNGRVSEFYIERGDEENSGIVGNIYKGKVMRVLPGMQSAFVEIGLERDAFLYVSDFFDEEEEIERIVMEKSKKSTPEEVKREADEQIQKARLEREKQMEAVQELAEPMAETAPEAFAEDEPEADEAEPVEAEKKEDLPREKQGEKQGKQRRGRRERQEQAQQKASVEESQTTEPNDNSTETNDSDSSKGFAEITADEAEEINLAFKSAPLFEMDDSSFERIVDDEETTGDMFKDAYRQEAITDKVRAIEFDMESTATAKVGSLLDSVTSDASGFERIADADDEQPSAPTPPSKSKGGRGSRGGKGKPKAAKAVEIEEPAEINPVEAAENEDAAKTKDSAKPKKPAETKAPVNKKKNRGGKKSAKNESLEDAEAAVKESDSTAQMAVRRGGRNRRRPNERPDNSDAPEGEEITSLRIVAEPEVQPESVKPAYQPPVNRPTPSSRPSSSNYRGDNRNESRSEGRTDNRNEGRSDSRNDNRSDNSRRERAGSGSGNTRRDRERNQPTITDLLREGQEILVQIAKEPIAKKGARITSHIALPGRFLVYMPTIEHLGVSRKIESASERSRLRVAIQKIRAEEDVPSGGFIVRTAGVGVPELDLRQDARYLVRTWTDMRKTAEKAKSPALVHQDLDIIQRLLRDQLSDDFTAIRVDSEDEYQRIVEFINRIQPRMVNRVKLYTRDQPILEEYGVQEEIDKALKPRVWLKSGGYLVINQTEALVAIDVNTGKFVGKGNARLEDTITKTNMEAVDEIARQIRLRDLGGIIVLDLIDMEDRRNRNKVSQALQEALQGDKSPTKVLSFNDFGLIIMTRKRVKQSLERTMCEPCEYCEGAGWVKSAQTVCFEILEEARRLSRSVEDVRKTTLRVHPEVARALNESENTVLEEIEAYLGNVDVTGDKSIHQQQFDFAFV
ncbi:MAG: Rne/Rng family ribonuclease [Acidobacteriota bacterium]|nr:Rne/Rng family ribonuclease [Acidobacteriota bacterium]